MKYYIYIQNVKMFASKNLESRSNFWLFLVGKRLSFENVRRTRAVQRSQHSTRQGNIAKLLIYGYVSMYIFLSVNR